MADAVTDTADAIAAAGGSARAYRADVSDPDSVRAAVDGAAPALAKLHSTPITQTHTDFRKRRDRREFSLQLEYSV